MPGGPPRSRRTTAVILGALVLLSLGLGWRLLAGAKNDESADPKSSGATPHADGSGTSGPSSAMGTADEKLRVKVLDTKPHDPTVFTQGLEISGDRLYESGGLVGKSVIRVSSFPEMNLMTSVTLDPAEFAEGITVMPNGDLIQLTWKDRVAYRRGRDDLAVTDRFDYAEEGWGVCFDGDKSALVTSDGSDRLSFRDPQTLRIIDSLQVTLGGRPLRSINELECTEDGIFANVWQTDTIVRIDPNSGVVEAEIDASGLLSEAEAAAADVLNGIAAIDDDQFLITGKNWPRAYVVRFEPA